MSSILQKCVNRLAIIKIAKVSAEVAIVVIVCIFALSFADVHAQTAVSFNAGNQFPIPEYNGSVSFALNGTYASATFENNTWTFTNIIIPHFQLIKNFEISTQNSNLTILSLTTSNNTFQGVNYQSARFRYEVEGQGKQIFNLGVGVGESGTYQSQQWSVSVNGKSLAEGSNGWTISHSGTMTVNGASGNVTINFINFSNFGGSIPKSNLPFYQQHSVAIAVSVAVALVVVVAVVIRVKSNAKPENV
jgi:hypothetical protein